MSFTPSPCVLSSLELESTGNAYASKHRREKARLICDPPNCNTYGTPIRNYVETEHPYRPYQGELRTQIDRLLEANRTADPHYYTFLLITQSKVHKFDPRPIHYRMTELERVWGGASRRFYFNETRQTPVKLEDVRVGLDVYYGPPELKKRLRIQQVFFEPPTGRAKKALVRFDDKVGEFEINVKVERGERVLDTKQVTADSGYQLQFEGWFCFSAVGFRCWCWFSAVFPSCFLDS